MARTKLERFLPSEKLQIIPAKGSSGEHLIVRRASAGGQ
jgi:hypothetical protein